jgi:hypothetical protein
MQVLCFLQPIAAPNKLAFTVVATVLGTRDTRKRFESSFTHVGIAVTASTKATLNNSTTSNLVARVAVQLSTVIAFAQTCRAARSLAKGYMTCGTKQAVSSKHVGNDRFGRIDQELQTGMARGLMSSSQFAFP